MVSIIQDKLLVDNYLLGWSPVGSETFQCFNYCNKLRKLLSYVVEVQDLNMIALNFEMS